MSSGPSKGEKQESVTADAEKVALPTPLELANLAAHFLPDNLEDRTLLSHDLALQEAAKLYLRACRFHAKHKHDTLEEFAKCVREPIVFLDQYAARIQGRNFHLEPDKKIDTARKYLAEQKVPLKTVRSVLDNLRQMTWFQTCEQALRRARKMPEVPTGLTQKERDQAYEREAIALGFVSRAVDEETWGKSVFPAKRIQREDGREIYVISEIWLSLLVKWKKARKQTGGKKSLATKPAKKNRKESH